MFIDKKGVKCRNQQEQVAKNQKDIADIYEDIDDIYARLNLINAAYIEIDDSEEAGQGELTEEQLTKLTNFDFVYVVVKKSHEIYLAFGGEKYQEDNVILKSLSAAGYARVIRFDLEERTWQYYESDEDLDSLVQRVEDLEKTKLGKEEAEETYANKEELAEKQDAIEYIDIDQDEGTLTQEQIAILTASELNYIWYNNMHRLTFRYRDNNAGLATYASNDQNQYHSIEINVQTGHYVAYNGFCEKQMTQGENVQIDRDHGESPIINVFNAAVKVLTTAPTSRYIDGGAIIVHLPSSEGITEYDGYIYMYDED